MVVPPESRGPTTVGAQRLEPSGAVPAESRQARAISTGDKPSIPGEQDVSYIPDIAPPEAVLRPRRCCREADATEAAPPGAAPPPPPPTTTASAENAAPRVGWLQLDPRSWLEVRRRARARSSFARAR